MSEPWICLPPLSPQRYAQILRRAIFECCKWHTQVEDRPILCSFPLVLEKATWTHLTTLAARLAQETLDAENELLRRADLHGRLGFPRPVRECLKRIPEHDPTRGGARVMRFDFHWTSEGWRISEANTDAAGGFIEASGVTRLVAEEYPDCEPAGDPAGSLIAAVRRCIEPAGVVGLMHLSIFSEDRQVMLYLADRLQESGLSACLFSPDQLRWAHGQAGVESEWYSGRLAMLIRFFPAEWLPRLSEQTGWQSFIAGGQTPVCNPAYAVLTQSKRFPLVWDELSTLLPTWRTLLPATLSPTDVPGRLEDGWVLKPALGHEGYKIAMWGVDEPANWHSIRKEVDQDPANWAAQRRFAMLPVQTPEGPLYPCLGIYVIDGNVAGAYCRVAGRPLIDDRSREVVVLIQKTAPESLLIS